ncbi:MAG: HEPN domain-containing protein [Myxococcaceae bacterium]
MLLPDRLAFDQLAHAARSLNVERGIALNDLRTDEALRSLPHFEATVASFRSSQLVVERFGAENAERLVLQLLHNCPRTQPNDAAVDRAWNAFVTELALPEWRYVAVGALRNIECADGAVQLGPNVLIGSFGSSEVRSCGISDISLQAIRREAFRDFSFTDCVLVVSGSTPKDASNIVQIGCDGLFDTAARAICALRLSAPGLVSVGPLWVERLANFDVLGGHAIYGTSVPSIGTRFRLDAASAERARAILPRIARPSEVLAPGDFEISLSTFMSSFDRWPRNPANELVDIVTALEALLGSDGSMKLALRVASLLANDDTERPALFDEVTKFYRVRSKFVHGERLQQQMIERLTDVERLREYLRRLLRAFAFASPPAGAFDRLDARLLSSTEREGLRKTLGL